MLLLLSNDIQGPSKLRISELSGGNMLCVELVQARHQLADGRTVSHRWLDANGC